MKKRKRGRPKGTTKLPLEYYSDLRTLPDLDLRALPDRLRFKRQQSLRAICIDIIKKAGVDGVRWLDERGRRVATITDPNVLRTRIIEARQRLRNIKIICTTKFETGNVGTLTTVANLNIVVSASGKLRRSDIWIGKRKLHN
jgi:hypothetical protein